MGDTVVATMAMARGMLMPMPLLRLPLMPSLAMDTMAVATDMAAMADTDVSMVDMEDTDTARGRLRLLLMLSPAMATMAVDTDMVATDTDVSMEDMVDTDTERERLRPPLMLSPAMATTAVDTDTERGALRLMLSPDMDTTAVDMEVMAMDVSM